MQPLAFHKGSRSKVLAVLLLGIMFIFVSRLFYLQIMKHDYYVKQSDAEQIKPLIIPAKRGLIYGLDGSSPVPLVINQTVYTMFADPTEVSDPGKVVSTIRRLAGSNLRPNLDSLLGRKDTRYQILGTALTRRQAESIKKENFTGIGFQEQSQRVYPEGSLAAQTLGFVNANGDGQYGIEGALNDQLTGKDGLLKSVTDVSGVPLTIGNQNVDIPAKNGQNIALTLDRNIQSYTEKALAAGLKRTGATNGSAVVMDPQTGRVMAMANLPTYNPTDYGRVKSESVYQNAIISAPYEAGSVVKSLTISAGLDKNIITPSSTFYNRGTIQVDGTTIQNASTTEALGTQTMQTALTDSLNTGMVTIAERLGDGSHITKKARDTIYDYFHNRFGFGRLTGIELTGESPGIIISPDSVQGNAVRYSNMVFGQGMDITMIQMASAFSSIINGGVYYEPTVIAGTVDNDGNLTAANPKISHQVVNPDTSRKVKKMLEVDRRDNGAVDPAGYQIGGKTGTSQALVNGRYSFTQTVGTYIGFGGDNVARYVIMVQVSGKGKNLQGAHDAAPIFTDVSNWLIDYLKLQPKG
ncbi:MAG: penicillin-binding protein 2 [Candidatus Nomurabacteria bacterium]|nr:MAG: penicillin-binding protein 2 [Candidatus Nomurabacteria bacterium]